MTRKSVFWVSFLMAVLAVGSKALPRKNVRSRKDPREGEKLVS